MSSKLARDVAAGEAGAAPELTEIGARRRLQLAGISFVGRRRRPSGERPPLPHPIHAGGWAWLTVLVAVAAAWTALAAWSPATRWWYRVDHELVYAVTDLRSTVVTPVMEAVAGLASIWSIRAVRVGTVLVLLAFRRWRALILSLLVLVVTGWAAGELGLALTRERPLGVEIIGSWSGGSHPAQPVVALTITLVVALMTLVPSGSPRRIGAGAAAAVIAAVSVARIYLGVDHPSDDLFAALPAAAFGVLAFRLALPDSVFPVRYRRGRAAHLDIGGRRGGALRRAASEALGVEVTGVEYFGLAGSAGSTPLRLTVTGAAGPTWLFAKLYSSAHLRSDRWYKVGRDILYGQLEDEIRFASVSRLVEHEDYMLRIMEDAGVPGAQPYGIVEITPEREYLLVMEFFAGSQELTEAEVDDEVIDQAIALVRNMWDARLAHRDVKPANVIVHRGRVLLIDVAFATARPTPWRQAVDLANMMLALALRADPERVYERALLRFAESDVAEAFAATHGVTMPAQLRAELRRHRAATGVDLIERFRNLAPHRDIVHIQRWSLRRATLAVGAAAGVILFVYLVAENIRRTGLL